MSHPDLRASLAHILSRAARPGSVPGAGQLQDDLRALGGPWTDVLVQVDEDEVVVRSARGEARLFRMEVTGWLLASGTFSPERAAERVAAALAPEIEPISL